jgi:hypothetical protein
MNPILETLRQHLPLRTCYINTLRTVGSPLVFNLKKPGLSRFIRKEEFEPAGSDVVARTCEVTRDVTISITPEWKDMETLEEWIESAAWELGAWDMEASPDGWKSNPGNGIGVSFCGLDSVYSIPGSNGSGQDNWEMGDHAAREGWWSWCFKPNAGWGADSIPLKTALRGDASLQPDGSRRSPFPGWLRTGRFAGRSGDWWLGLAKSFEVSDDPGTALRIVWDFRKRMLGLGQ